MNTCPICGKTLGADDLIVAHYYPVRDWWVTLHLVEIKQASADEQVRYRYQGKDYRDRCGEADIHKVTLKR